MYLLCVLVVALASNDQQLADASSIVITGTVADEEGISMLQSALSPTVRQDATRVYQAVLSGGATSTLHKGIRLETHPETHAIGFGKPAHLVQGRKASIIPTTPNEEGQFLQGFAEAVAAPLWPRWLVATVIVTCGASATLIYARTQASSDPSAALTLGVTFCFQDKLCSTILLMDAYSIAQALDGTTQFSGLITGAYELGGVSGQLLVWVSFVFISGAWRKGKDFIVSAAICQCIGAAGVGLAICLRSQGAAASNLRASFLVARGVQGFGGGVQQALVANQFGHLYPARERPLRLLSLYLACALGLGASLLVPSLLSAPGHPISVSDGDSVPRFMLTTLVAAAFPFINLICLAYYPSLDKVPDFYEEEVNTPKAQHYSRRKFLILATLLCAMGRSLGTYMWQEGFMLLVTEDHQYTHWQNILTTVGMLIMCLFVRVIYARYYKRAFSYVRVLWAVALGGLMLTQLVSRSALIVGSILLLPSLYMTGAFFTGISQNHALPPNFFLGMATTTLLLTLGCDLVGYLVGPVLARRALQFGWSSLWIGELLIVLLTASFSEFMLAASDPRWFDWCAVH